MLITKHVNCLAMLIVDGFYRLERLPHDAQSSGYSSDDHMNLKRPKRSQVLPYGQENELRPYYHERRRHVVSEEARRHESNQIGTEFVPFDNPVGNRYNWKRAGRLIKDSMR